jgi:hypothetical protein
MTKPKMKNRPRTYQKRLTLYPLKFEEAVALLLKAKLSQGKEKKKAKLK